MRLFEPFAHARLSLKNHVVMSPMTRSRAVDAATANALMAEYYGQRAGAGLIITEGTSPSPNGLGYPRIPGLFNEAHAKGWRLVTEAVHAKQAKIFVQLMHTGRVGRVENLAKGAELLGVTDVAAPGKIYVDGTGEVDNGKPRAMTAAEVQAAVDEFAKAAKLAVQAGFDGIELHGANGYLIEQFLNANINTRTDAFGGDAARRNRFALDVARATAAAIGPERVGIRVSPYGVHGSTGPFEGIDAQFVALMRELSAIGIAYVHLVDHVAMGAPALPPGLRPMLREAFNGVFIASGGFDRDSAETLLKSGGADLIAFGRPWLANPDLIARMEKGAALSAPDFSTAYTPGPKGYTDYPRLDG